MRLRFGVSALCLLVVPAVAQDRPSAFYKCVPCHAIGEGAGNKVGPPLNGIVDQPAGRADGYNYSISLQSAADDGLVWTREMLTRYLKKPKHLMPGTRMTFAGMGDRAEIDEIIDYLASLAPDGTQIVP